MNATFQTTARTPPKPDVTSTRSSLVQRRCACPGGSGDCECDEQNGPQMKLAVSRPGDAFEEEADRVASQVMRMALPGGISPVAPVISRQTAPEEEEDEPQDLSSLLSASRKESDASDPTVTGEVAEQVRSMRGGAPLPAGLREFFEPRFQHDFGTVRVHTDANAANTTRALHARAYTLGSDIAFAPGEYAPQTEAGRSLLAHELTHVIQQRDAVQTVMRACDCAAAGYGRPNASTRALLSSAFPNLGADDYCVTGPATPTYNCYAWSIGVTNRWVESEVDTAGDNDGTLEYSDFDQLYARHGLRPITNATPVNPVVALYGTATAPKHAALNTGAACGKFESKLGQHVRISHWMRDLEGGSVYGDINRFYVRS